MPVFYCWIDCINILLRQWGYSVVQVWAPRRGSPQLRPQRQYRVFQVLCDQPSIMFPIPPVCIPPTVPPFDDFFHDGKAAKKRNASFLSIVFDPLTAPPPRRYSKGGGMFTDPCASTSPRKAGFILHETKMNTFLVAVLQWADIKIKNPLRHSHLCSLIVFITIWHRWD